MKVLIANNEYQWAVEFVSHQTIEKLKQKWTAFTTGIIDVIAAEEMKISREEFDKQIELAHFKHSQLRAVDGALSNKKTRKSFVF